MSTQIIPTNGGTPFYNQVTTLDGVDYLFSFHWNARDGYWYFDMADQDGVPIVSSVKLVVSWDLLRRCVDARRPPGLLFAQDTSGAFVDAGFSDLGERVLLSYTPAADLAVFIASPTPPA